MKTSMQKADELVKLYELPIHLSDKRTTLNHALKHVEQILIDSGRSWMGESDSILITTNFWIQVKEILIDKLKAL